MSSNGDEMGLDHKLKSFGGGMLDKKNRITIADGFLAFLKRLFVIGTGLQLINAANIKKVPILMGG